MKYTILLIFCLSAFSTHTQVNSSIPPEANIFYNKVIEIIRPEIKKLVHTFALQSKKEKAVAARLIKQLKKETVLKNLNEADIEGVAVLMMVQATKNTDEEMKRMVMSLRKNPDQKDSVETKRLIDFKSFLAQNIRKIMNKSPYIQESVINNLKP